MVCYSAQQTPQPRPGGSFQSRMSLSSRLASLQRARTQLAAPDHVETRATANTSQNNESSTHGASNIRTAWDELLLAASGWQRPTNVSENGFGRTGRYDTATNDQTDDNTTTDDIETHVFADTNFSRKSPVPMGMNYGVGGSNDRQRFRPSWRPGGIGTIISRPVAGMASNPVEMSSSRDSARTTIFESFINPRYRRTASRTQPTERSNQNDALPTQETEMVVLSDVTRVENSEMPRFFDDGSILAPLDVVPNYYFRLDPTMSQSNDQQNDPHSTRYRSSRSNRNTRAVFTNNQTRNNLRLSNTMQTFSTHPQQHSQPDQIYAPLSRDFNQPAAPGYFTFPRRRIQSQELATSAMTESANFQTDEFEREEFDTENELDEDDFEMEDDFDSNDREATNTFGRRIVSLPLGQPHI